MITSAMESRRWIGAGILLGGIVSSGVALLYPHWYQSNRHNFPLGRHYILNRPRGEDIARYGTVDVDSVRRAGELTTTILVTAGLLVSLGLRDSDAFIQPFLSRRVLVAAVTPLAFPYFLGPPLLVFAFDIIQSGGVGSMYSGLSTLPALVVLIVPYWVVCFVGTYLITSLAAKLYWPRVTASNERRRAMKR